VWRYVGRKEETRLKSNGRYERMENTKYGRRREGRWTPIRAKAQDTRVNPKSWETHLVRKRCDIGLLRALSPGIMMTPWLWRGNLIYFPTSHVYFYVGGQSLYLSWMGAWMDLLPVDPPVTKSTCSCSVMVRAPVPVNIG